MKRLLLFIICVYGVCGVYAQSQPAKLTFNYYSSETLDALDLTAKQRESIITLKKNTDSKVRSIKADKELSEDDKKKLFKQIYAEASQVYNEITTDKQKSKIRQLQADITNINLKNGYTPNIDSNYRNPHFDKRMELFKQENAPKGGVIFLGNSITERGNWNELFAPEKIINRGIGGDNTFGVLGRLNDIITLQPSKLFLMIGVNDLASRGWPVELVFANYTKIVNRVLKESPTTKMYLVSVLPINENLVSIERFKGRSPNIRAFNAKVEVFAKENKLPYIDLYNQFTDGESFLKGEYTKDGIHLLDKGYNHWKAIFTSQKIELK